MKSKCDLVLASSSPRRRQLLEMSGFSFRVHVGPYLEPTPKTVKIPQNFAKELAFQKALSSLTSDRKRNPNTVYLAADTIVVLGMRLFGKPESKADAKRILCALSGKRHSVVTGWVLLSAQGEIQKAGASLSNVFWNKIDSLTIKMASSDPQCLDKAGAYAFQGHSLMWTNRILGSPSNIIGLPLEQVNSALRSIGIRQWTHKHSKKIT